MRTNGLIKRADRMAGLFNPLVEDWQEICRGAKKEIDGERLLSRWSA